tara:strand:+ start:501 stop:926 length:426 start_codon:yes stop_codon:yes gene_type:complete
MDIRKIKTLIEMLEESNLNEIEVTQGEESVRITKDKNNDESIVKNNLTNLSVENEDLSGSDIVEGNIMTSPIVGTFYRKPAPDKEPFVKVGDVVNKGDVLCIIEAMKMMNEIKSEHAGKIASIEIEDGQPVEFGQTIVVIQ